MLQTQSVYPSTLELLRKLMNFEPLNDFNLVGGTALALQLGHRISDDIDFFTNLSFDKLRLKLELSEYLKNYKIEWQVETDHAMIFYVDEIKIDIIKYPYPILKILKWDNIRLVSTKDIAAMKLSAIAQRGSKKDFFDLYELLGIYTLKEMLQLYSDKLVDSETSYLIRSLTYFDDAEIQKDPIMLKAYNWDDVKGKIKQEVKRYLLNE